MLTFPSSIAVVTKLGQDSSAPEVNGEGAETIKANGGTEHKSTPPPVVWPDLEKGEPKRTYRNARAAIHALGVTCKFDVFHDRMIIGGQAIEKWNGEISDAAMVMLRQLIIDAYGLDCGKDHVHDAATELCLENSFDPIVNYLDDLIWDGEPRLENWLSTYLGAEQTALNQAIARLTLIAAVRRVRQPGCKFDHILVLEGPEGGNKSTLIAGAENFSDQTILTASDKEQQELVRGIWIFEIADLAGMKKSEAERVKAFASRQYDRARPAYGRRRIDAARRCIFIGTTNEDVYLASQTGNRRFWPVKTDTIDIVALRRDRDQLWAEAAAEEAKGEPLLLAEDLWDTAKTEQDDRTEQDPWEDILADVAGLPYDADADDDAKTRAEWIKAQALLGHLEIKHERASAQTYKRLRSVMKKLGWANGRHRFGGKKRQRGYWRPWDGQ